MGTRKLASEGLGTFAVAFMGFGAAAVGGAQLGAVGIALAFGLALAVVAVALAPISGAHLNPAVSVAMTIAGRLSPRELVRYVAAQTAGGVAGAALAIQMAQARPGGALLVARSLASGYDRGSPGFYGVGAAAIASVALTGLFVLVALSVAPRAAGRTEPGLASPLRYAAASGLAFGLVHLVGAPVANVVVNPALSAGPALSAAGVPLAQLWLFVLAPIVGAIAGGLIHRFVLAEPAPVREIQRDA